MAIKTYDDLCGASLAGAVRQQNAHYAAAAYYQWYGKLVGLPAAMFGSVTTASMASQLGEGSLSQTATLVATVCGIISLISSSLLSTLNLPSLANQHQTAAVAWGALRGKLERLATAELATNPEIDVIMQRIGDEWDQINRASPVLYTRFFRNSDKEKACRTQTSIGVAPSPTLP